MTKALTFSLLFTFALGNVAVLKPSEFSSRSEALLSNLITKYLDPDCFKVVCGDGAVAASLLKQQWDFIFYTGSTRVGKIVATAAAATLTPYLLELGGKSPAYIDASVTDITVATKRILWGKLINAGQTCIAPDVRFRHTDLICSYCNSYGIHSRSMSSVTRISTTLFLRLPKKLS